MQSQSHLCFPSIVSQGRLTESAHTPSSIEGGLAYFKTRIFISYIQFYNVSLSNYFLSIMGRKLIYLRQLSFIFISIFLSILQIMSKDYQLDCSLQEYINTLKSYGVQINPKLFPAYFRLQNGLQYPGLLAKDAVTGPQGLVYVPIDLILTSHRALRDIELQDVFRNRFYNEGPLWQDRILVTYLLYLLSVNRDCIWTFMARHFSKYIDIISFWDEAQLQMFADPSVIKAARKERNHFEQEYSQFQQLREEYSQLADQKWFNRENYKWIYIHTVSRCFGSFLNSTYFVPYCELFNHSPVNVSYRCVTQQELQALKTKQKNKEESKSATQQDQGPHDDSSQSISSCYSEDYLSDDDFDYLSINSYSIKWLTKISYDLKQKQTRLVDNFLADLYAWMQRELEWCGFTLIYLGQIIQKVKILENQYKAGRKKFAYTMQRLEETKLHMHAYRAQLVQFYRKQGREYQKGKRNSRGVDTTHTKDTSWASYTKSQQQKPNNYSHFLMEARQGAHFGTEQQIYFSYGKLSNRNLLVRYGFCLQNNPFDHLWLKHSLRKEIEPYPDLFQQIQEKGLPVNFKMKLKGHTFAMEPVILLRMKAWKLTHHSIHHIFCITDIDSQLSLLEKLRKIYQKALQPYTGIRDDLKDPAINHHQYFARTYNIEKRKILLFQIALVDKAQTLFLKIKSQQLDVRQLLKKKQWNKSLRHYYKGLRGLIPS